MDFDRKNVIFLVLSYNIQKLKFTLRSKYLNLNQQINIDIKPTDIERGILNLIDRGLVPPAAEIELKPSPIMHDKAILNASRPHVEALKERTKTPIQSVNNRKPDIKYDYKGKTIPYGLYSYTYDIYYFTADCRIVMKDNVNAKWPQTSANGNTPLPPPATPAHNQNNHGMRFMESIERYDPHKHGLSHGLILNPY